MFGLPTEVVVIAGSLVLGLLMLMIVIARMYRKVGPNEALIRYGMGGTHVYCGRGAIIFPMVQTCRELSLELMSFDVAPQQNLYTKQGVAVTVEAVAQIKVKSDQESILTAAEQFLSKEQNQREGLIRLVMEGHLRGIIGQLTVEQIVKEPEMVGDRMRSTCADDMSKMGLEVVSFTLKEVRDKNEYITNMGRPDVARIKRDAEVATAEAERDIAIKRAEATRASAVAKAQADQERVAAETASLAKKAAFLEATKKAQAQADKSYEIETNVQQQHVIAEAVKVQQVEREAQVKVQEAEIARRERELIATVLKQAEIERQRIETLANAERQRLMTEAEGRASAIRAQGEAEAEIIFKKGEAEAKAMNIKAEAFQEYNQAAVVDKLITGLPDVVRALSEPLSKVDKVTIVSTGNGDAAGAYKLTGDVTKIAAQVPALFEALSGMQMSDLLSKVRLIGDKAPKPEQPPLPAPKKS